MLRTTIKGKNQNKPYQGNCQRNGYQNSLVHLGLFSYKKINNNQNKTACQTSNRKKSNPKDSPPRRQTKPRLYWKEIQQLVFSGQQIIFSLKKMIAKNSRFLNTTTFWGGWKEIKNED